LGVTSNVGFFREQEAPAVLKHGILKRYPVVFASAAGQLAARVVLLDGYAGRGRYEDETPGSPMLLLDTAARTSSFRNVECLFVERDRANFDELCKVIDEHRTADVSCEAYEGELSSHLDAILDRATDAALFAFLDPFGTALDYDELTQRFLGRPERPSTEMLLHFSVNAVRRIGGLLRKLGAATEARRDADRKTIERVDRFLGGNWWHEIAHGATDEPGSATRIAEQVADRYCRKIAQATNYGALWYPVRDRPDLSPEYFLVLFARHPYAFWRFNDALSKANVEWQEAWRGKANTKATAKATRERELARAHGVMSLFGDEYDDTVAAHPELPPFDEKAESARWVQTIEANLTTLLQQGAPFRLMDKIGDVYGDTLGLAREMHVKEALGNLHVLGVCPDNGKGKDIHKRTIRPQPAAGPAVERA
jgi:three-Cys-motif partner protein